MGSYQMTFMRYEKKYLLDDSQYNEFIKKTGGRLVPDDYGTTTICNIYFDTPDAQLIRASLDKPVYKEKLRLRSYGKVVKDGPVFLELKKKYQGIVYKRRENMVLSEAEGYLLRHEKPGVDTQILREIDWFLQFYKNIEPAMYIAYDRIAAYDIQEPELRVTFDWNIRFRDQELDLKKGTWGQQILEEGQQLMEIKIPGAMPVWLSGILDQLHIYPISFSKYGRAYRMQSEEKGKEDSKKAEMRQLQCIPDREEKGGRHYA